MKHVNKNLTPGQADDMAVQLEQEIVEILLQEGGMHERDAALQATVLVKGLRERLGGQRLGTRGLYIPAPDKSSRDEAIRQEWNGKNRRELMRKYNVRRSRFYEIIKGKPNQVVVALSHLCPVSSHETGQEKQ
ncbi:Mor transcription activator family protein [Comamonas sp. BIGb0124]|uniref:Mor transcription activator family protein n=1 Tax=Comamonas sp. BIGb0124 TaxID=2485130 RepID=UPI000FB06715|nr:Mor transcription activator family protein [Comamonas sp. BIGb0124]ROR25151.1 Mor transcription activator family protein [Comamonas sp. BIGb0124]